MALEMFGSWEGEEGERERAKWPRVMAGGREGG
jgi:hypothetical protein